MKALKVKFLGAEIVVIDYNGKPYVPMKPIVENIGLEWHSQRKRISRDEVLNAVKVVMTSTGSDNKSYDMTTIPLSYLNGWLFGVDTKRVKPSIREKLLKYKKECYEVLWQYWENGVVNRERVKARLEEIDEWDKQTLKDGQKGSALMLSRKKALREIRLERIRLIQGELFENFDF